MTLVVAVGLPGNNAPPKPTGLFNVTVKLKFPPGAKPFAATLQIFRIVGLKTKFVNSVITSPGLCLKATLPILGVSAAATFVALPSNVTAEGAVSPLGSPLQFCVAENVAH
jgi:hypothetical protein